MPYTDENRIQWEAKLIEYVIVYIQQMTDIVKPTTTVYIAVDGVAPMAKIKQQRARRFKSAREAATLAQITAEARNTTYKEEPRWDTTAITPGTQFMSKLSTALREYASRHPKVRVSPADEPGEGEQKIMEHIRKFKPASSVVYGLDADLIILSLMTGTLTDTSIDLFREEVEFNGSIKMDSLDTEQFLYMNMAQLHATLYSKYGNPRQSKAQFIYDFVGLMSLLGNDFVPHGMALKIRDDGIPKLMEIYGKVALPLVDPKSWTYHHDALCELYNRIGGEEPALLLKAVKHKLEARVGSNGSKDAAEQAISRYNDTPVLWAAESILVNKTEKVVTALKPDWEEKYDKAVYSLADQEKVVTLYLQAVAWTLKYYAGEAIDTWFYYPWFLPPRSTTIHTWLKSNRITPPTTSRPPLHPQHQLAMVLPADSFHLLPPHYAALPRTHPYAWPTDWAVYSFGRRFMWECEPLIPLIEPRHMMAWTSEL